MKPAWALQSLGSSNARSLGDPRVLAGTQFALEIAETAVNFTGKPRHATTVNGVLPGPLLRWRRAHWYHEHACKRTQAALAALRRGRACDF